MLVPAFKGWPADQITISFWMWSLDACRPGVPISYARADSTYGHGDNDFLLFDYQSWRATWPACCSPGVLDLCQRSVTGRAGVPPGLRALQLLRPGRCVPSAGADVAPGPVALHMPRPGLGTRTALLLRASSGLQASSSAPHSGHLLRR